MKIEWNKVTWYSKLGAVILFLIVVPILTFYIGIEYQSVKDLATSTDVPAISIPKPLTYLKLNPPIPSDWKTYTNAQYGFSFRYPFNSKILQQGATDYGATKKVDDIILDSNNTKIDALVEPYCRFEFSLGEKKVAFDDPILSFGVYAQKRDPTVGEEKSQLVENLDGTIKGIGYINAGEYVFPYDDRMVFDIAYLLPNEATDQDRISCSKITEYMASSITTKNQY